MWVYQTANKTPGTLEQTQDKVVNLKITLKAGDYSINFSALSKEMNIFSRSDETVRAGSVYHIPLFGIFVPSASGPDTLNVVCGQRTDAAGTAGKYISIGASDRTTLIYGNDEDFHIMVSSKSEQLGGEKKLYSASYWEGRLSGDALTKMIDHANESLKELFPGARIEYDQNWKGKGEMVLTVFFNNQEVGKMKQSLGFDNYAWVEGNFNSYPTVSRYAQPQSDGEAPRTIDPFVRLDIGGPGGGFTLTFANNGVNGIGLSKK